MMKQRKKEDAPPVLPHQYQRKKKAKNAGTICQDHLLWERVATTIRPLNSKNNHFTAIGNPAKMEGEFSEKCEADLGQKNQKNKELDKKYLYLNRNLYASHAQLTKAKQQETGVIFPLFNSSHTALPFMDTKSRKKISRGQLKIEAQLDLHGLDSARAHTLLLKFISKAAWEGKKYVLVITGKGHSKALSERQGSIFEQKIRKNNTIDPQELYSNRNRHPTRNDSIYAETNRRRDNATPIGVLRQSVPLWLETAPFRLYVSAIEEAARHHGGSGAFYVRLRLPRRATS